MAGVTCRDCAQTKCVLRHEKGNLGAEIKRRNEKSRLSLIQISHSANPKRDERIAPIILNATLWGLALCSKRKHEQNEREQCGARCTWEMPGLFLISHSEGSIYSLGSSLQLIKPNNIKAIHVTLICQRRKKACIFSIHISAVRSVFADGHTEGFLFTCCNIY
jgi:hypothetical protein